ncbi:MAG: hypothetical protein ACJAXQ_001241 [Parvibaculaceae bacterium]
MSVILFLSPESSANWKLADSGVEGMSVPALDLVRVGMKEKPQRAAWGFSRSFIDELA